MRGISLSFKKAKQILSVLLNLLLFVTFREAEGESQRTFLFVAYGASLVIREKEGRRRRRSAGEEGVSHAS